MDEQAFRFNSEAKYAARGVYPNSALSLIRASIQVNTGNDGSFHTDFSDIFQKYLLPHVSSNELVQAWNNSPMQFWQNQMNFAVWSATTGCGVSQQDHLAADDPLMGALYRFHVYYQIRRILNEIQAPLPQDRAWSALNNPYDRRAYERICSEFGVSPHTDWRRHGVNHGLGKVMNYWTNGGYHPVGHVDYELTKMSFTKQTTNEVLHVDYIEQDGTAETAWSEFVLDKSHGFTRPGVERLNDSIRTYVWAILGAQAQTRTRILGNGTAFDAQKQFVADMEDAISSPVDLPAAIKRYQDVLQYAGSKVDFVFGIGLYMAPSNMVLHIGQLAGYNNEIVVATPSQKLGMNGQINASVVIAVTDTGEKGLVRSVELQPRRDEAQQPRATEKPQSRRDTVAGETAKNRLHEEEKTALVVGAAGIGSLL